MENIATMEPIKLLIVDIDGVLTNGNKTYDTMGNVVAKTFNDKDFTAIKMFKEHGVDVVFLSGDTRCNYMMAQKRGIPFYNARAGGELDKARFVSTFCDEYNLDVDDLAYIGDDEFDLDIMKELPWTFCPSDASPNVQRAVFHVLSRAGGTGVLAELFAYYEERVIYGDFN